MPSIVVFVSICSQISQSVLLLGCRVEHVNRRMSKGKERPSSCQLVPLGSSDGMRLSLLHLLLPLASGVGECCVGKWLAMSNLPGSLPSPSQIESACGGKWALQILRGVLIFIMVVLKAELFLTPG